MALGARVEEDFPEQGIVLGEHTACNGQVALEGGAGRILVLHDGTEHEGAHEGNRQAVGHSLVVLLERVFMHVESKAAIEVEEEDAAHVVALLDDDGILGGERSKVGKGGTKHGMGAHEAQSCALIEVEEIGLHAADVADDAVLGQVGNHLLEDLQRVFQRHTVDYQFGLELLYLLH